MKPFLDGAIMTAFFVAGLFFLRFWARTHDRLFLLFAVAFIVMGINRIFQVALMLRGDSGDESQTVVYSIRLAAYLIIMLAIVDKNRSIGKRRTASPYRDLS